MKVTDAGHTLVLSETTPEQKKRILAALDDKPEAKPKPKLITRKQAADILGTCPETIKRYAKRGLLRPINFTSRRIRYEEAEILDFARNGAKEVRI